MSPLCSLVSRTHWKLATGANELGIPDYPSGLKHQLRERASAKEALTCQFFMAEGLRS
jgi:hypothetical protein